jgi:hypothetical protein
LQYNVFADEIASAMAGFVLCHLDEPHGEADKRMIREWTDGPQRVTRRSS